MKKIVFGPVLNPKLLFTLSLLFVFSVSHSQTIAENGTNSIWNKVQFGGGFGLSFGSGHTEIIVAPSAIYHVNDYVSLGGGLLGSFTNSKITTPLLCMV